MIEFFEVEYMDDLITIVVPVYNVEKYLGRCLDSILEQTYRNLEIILVNDGSTDGSESICKQYLSMDDRLRYIYQHNQGLAAARNAGIDRATGKYIAFVDSDDFIDKRYIETLYRLIIQYDCDISICGLIKTTQDKPSVKKKKWSEKVYNGQELIRDMYNQNMLDLSVACNKLLKISLFQKERFPVGKLYEDFVLCTKLIYRSNKVAYTTEPLYYYFQSKESITRRKFTLKNLDHITEIERKLFFFKETGEESLYRRCLQEYEVITLKLYYLCKRDVDNGKKECDELLTKYKRFFKETIVARENAFVKKIFICLGYCFPYLMGWIGVNIFKI